MPPANSSRRHPDTSADRTSEWTGAWTRDRGEDRPTNHRWDEDWIDQSPTIVLSALSLEMPGATPRLDISDMPTRRQPAITPDGAYAPLDEAATWILPVVTADAATTTATKVKAAAAGVEGYVALVRTLAKSSGTYALAAMLTPLISLILAPFLTHNLSQTDYGTLAILNTAIGLFAGITQLGLNSAFFRTYNYDYSERHEQNSVLATLIVILCAVSIPMAALVASSGRMLAGVLFGHPSAALGDDIALAAGVVLLQNLAVPGFAYLRAESKAAFFASLSLGNLIITLLANIVFVKYLSLGISGSLLATGCGYGVVTVCTLPLILIRAGLHVRRDVAWNLLTFGVPQVASLVSYWVLQVSDRYLLGLFGTLSQVAAYSVAYSLGSVVSTAVIAPFNLAWPTTMYSVAKRADAPHIFQLVFRWFSMLLLFAAFGLAIGSSVALTWLFPAGYHSAAPVIPVVAESIVFYGLYNQFMVGASITRKTWMPAAFTTLAALVNLGCNLVLIPTYGPIGAAVSTLIAYIVLACVAYFANQRIYYIPFEIGRFLHALLAGTALFLWANLLVHAWGPLWLWPVTVLSLLIYGAWLVLLGRGADATLVNLIRRR